MEQELIEEGESYCGTAACVRIRRSNGLVYVWESEVPAVVMTTTATNWDAFEADIERRGYERAQREIAAAIEAAAARIREDADSTSAGIALGAVLAEGARIARSALAVPLPEGETSAAVAVHDECTGADPTARP